MTLEACIGLAETLMADFLSSPWWSTVWLIARLPDHSSRGVIFRLPRPVLWPKCQFLELSSCFGKTALMFLSSVDCNNQKGDAVSNLVIIQGLARAAGSCCDGHSRFVNAFLLAPLSGNFKYLRPSLSEIIAGFECRNCLRAAA